MSGNAHQRRVAIRSKTIGSGYGPSWTAYVSVGRAQRAIEAMDEFCNAFGASPGDLVLLHGFSDPRYEGRIAVVRGASSGELSEIALVESDESVRERLRAEPFEQWLARTARVIEEARHDRR